MRTRRLKKKVKHGGSFFRRKRPKGTSLNSKPNGTSLNSKPKGTSLNSKPNTSLNSPIKLNNLNIILKTVTPKGTSLNNTPNTSLNNTPNTSLNSPSTFSITSPTRLTSPITSPATSITSPTTSITSPATSITSPATSITSPTTSITSPATSITSPNTLGILKTKMTNSFLSDEYIESWTQLKSTFPSCEVYFKSYNPNYLREKERIRNSLIEEINLNKKIKKNLMQIINNNGKIKTKTIDSFLDKAVSYEFAKINDDTKIRGMLKSTLKEGTKIGQGSFKYVWKLPQMNEEVVINALYEQEPNPHKQMEEFLYTNQINKMCPGTCNQVKAIPGAENLQTKYIYLARQVTQNIYDEELFLTDAMKILDMWSTQNLYWIDAKPANYGYLDKKLVCVDVDTFNIICVPENLREYFNNLQRLILLIVCYRFYNIDPYLCNEFANKYHINKSTYLMLRNTPLNDAQFRQVKSYHQTFLKQIGLNYSAEHIDEMENPNVYLPHYTKNDDGSEDLSFYNNCLD
jgi:hypothetical protein